MAKDKTVELNYKIEGLRRMVKRKVRRARKQRIKALDNKNLNRWNDDFNW